VKDEFRQEVLHKLAYVFRYGIEQATRQAGRLLVRTDPRFAKDFLLQLVNDEQAILSRRQQAALVLSELLRDHPRVIELLVDALKSPESDIRADAARALGRLESGTFLEPLTSSLETDGSPKVRMELLRAIEQITQSTTIDTSTQAVGFKAVRESHQDPDPGVRELAIEITGRLRAKFQ